MSGSRRRKRKLGFCPLPSKMSICQDFLLPKFRIRTMFTIHVVQICMKYFLKHEYKHGRMAQWSRRLTTNQEIPGSTPGVVANFFFHLSNFFTLYFI